MSNSISNNIFCNHIERFTRRHAIKGRFKLRFTNSSEPRINIIRISSQAWGGFSPLTMPKSSNPSKLKVEKDWGLTYSKVVSMLFGLIAYTYELGVEANENEHRPTQIHITVSPQLTGNLSKELSAPSNPGTSAGFNPSKELWLLQYSTPNHLYTDFSALIMKFNWTFKKS